MIQWTSADVRRLVDATREQVVLEAQISITNPSRDRVTRCRSDLKLDGPLSLTLHHDGSVGDPITVAYVAHPKRDQIACMWRWERCCRRSGQVLGPRKARRAPLWVRIDSVRDLFGTVRINVRV